MTEETPMPGNLDEPSLDESGLDESGADESGVDEQPRGGGRRAVVVSARIVTGIIGIGIAAVTLAAASFLPLPTHTAAVPSVLVTPISTAQQRVCAGPLLRLGNSAGTDATKAFSFGRPTVSSTTTSGVVRRSALPDTDNTAEVAPELVTVAAAGDDAQTPLFAASQSQLAVSDDVNGFAASECGAGTGESWLVGGATATGRTTLVSLSNPTEVSSTVDLTVYDENGIVSAAGTDGIIVPAGAQRVVSLAAFAPAIASPVVRVESRGGSIVATLQQTTVRILEPGGVDIVDPTSQPGLSSVIPGVTISHTDAVVAKLGEPGYEDLRSVIRILATGDATTHAQISVVPENSTAKAKPAALVTLKPGVVTDVPLGDFDDGTYTVTVTTDGPAVAGARVSTIGDSGQLDFAWYASAPPLTGSTVLVAAQGPSPVLTIANRGPSAASVAVTGAGAGGQTANLTVAPGESVSVPATGGAGYTIESSSPVSAAMSYLGDGQLAGYVINPPAAVSQPIRVYR